MEPYGTPSGRSTPALLQSNPGTPRSGESRTSRSSAASIRDEIRSLKEQLQTLVQIVTAQNTPGPVPVLTTTNTNEPVSIIEPLVTRTPNVRILESDIPTGIDIETDLTSAGGSISSEDARKKLKEPSTTRKDVRFSRTRGTAVDLKDEVDEEAVFTTAKPGRMSVLLEVMDQCVANDLVASPQVVAVAASSIDYSPCMLQSISIPSVLWFIETMTDFQRDHLHEKVIFNKAF